MKHIEVINNIKEIQTKYNLDHKVPIFATQEYADYLFDSRRIKTLWFIEKFEDEISLMIPFAISKKLFFIKGYFLTSVNNIANRPLDEEKLFLEKVVALIKKKKLCDWIQQSPNWAIFNTYPSGAVYIQFGTYKIKLEEKSLDELFNSVQKKDRYDINKAIRENIIIKKSYDYLTDSIKLINLTASEAGISSVDVQEINKIKTYLRNDLWVYVAYDRNNVPQSTAIFFSNHYSTYTIYGGSIKKPARGSTTYLYWEAIKESKLKNVKYFDFVGARVNPEPESKQARIQRFKEHFGGELYLGYLWKMPISKIKYYLYNIIIRLYTLLKGIKYKGDIIDQELRRLQK